MTRDPAEPTEGSASAFADADLLDRPGFLIRRLHQIHLSFFVEECSRFDTTPLQSSVLFVALKTPKLEQSRLAVAVGVDRATLAEVAARLEDRELIRRTSSPADRRVKLVTVTARGAALVDAMSEATGRAHERTLAALPVGERTAFVQSLRRLVESNNDLCRAPFR